MSKTELLKEQELMSYWKGDYKTPLLSVTLIAYNHEKFIGQAIESVLMQKTDFPFEVIIHDDASTDNTQSIIKKYAIEYSNIIVPILQKENHWLEKRINATATIVFPQARGKYIAWLEGDDYWTDPLKLQKQVDFLEANPEYSACFHLTELVYENSNNKEKVYYGVEAPNIMSAKDTLAIYSPFHTSSLVFRRDALPLPLPSWYNQVISADMALFSILTKYGPLGKISEVMSIYRKHANGITSTQAVISSYHKKRIELAHYLNEYHNFRFQDKAQEVITFHQQALQAVEPASYGSSMPTYDNFTNIPFSSDNLDCYPVRSAIFNALKETLPQLNGSLLDVGCGKMPYKQYILQHSSVNKYTGLDIASALVYDANVKPDITWDGVNMPINDESFDCAIATEVLEHCFEPGIILKETYRVLKPNGIFFFTVPFLWPLHEVPHDAYRYTPWALERLLRQAGFSEIQFFALGGWHASMAQMLGLWVRRCGLSPFKQKILSYLLKPIIAYLLNKDIRPVHFKESSMITGLYGIAKK